MAKHFPGPWIVGPVDDTLVRAVTTEGEYYTICEMDGNYNDPHQWPVMEANARLIAAAPDLLEACKDIATILDYGAVGGKPSEPILFETYHKLKRAIAKATGEEMK